MPHGRQRRRVPKYPKEKAGAENANAPAAYFLILHYPMLIGSEVCNSPIVTMGDRTQLPRRKM